MVVALAAGSLPIRLEAQTRLLIGLALAAAGELALTGLGTGTTWTRLVPGLFVTGVGTGVVNAALGRIAVESVPPGRAGMGSGANNTARYLGGAAGAALIVSIASAGGAHRLIDGWNTAALVSAGLSAVGVAIVASCRTWPRHSAPSTGHGSRGKEHLPAVPTPWTPPGPAQVLIVQTAGAEHPATAHPHSRTRRTG
jgi:MFS family permease